MQQVLPRRRGLLGCSLRLPASPRQYRQGQGTVWKDLSAAYSCVGSCGCIEPVPRYNIAVDGLCLPELGTSVLELSVFLQPKHGAFNNGSQDAFVVCAVPLQLGPRLPPFPLILFYAFIPPFKMPMRRTDSQCHLTRTQRPSSEASAPDLEEVSSAVLRLGRSRTGLGVAVWLEEIEPRIERLGLGSATSGSGNQCNGECNRG